MTARSTTERGFAIYDQFTDVYGSRIWVQQSSSATAPRVWIFARDDDDNDAPPHLSIEQAKRVRDALDAFIRENQQPCRAHPDDCPNGPEPHAYHPPELEGLPCCRQPGENPDD